MDIIIRFFDAVYNEVKVWYLDLRVTGHLSHQDLFEQCSSVLLKLDCNKIFQISMDGPSVV